MNNKSKILGIILIAIIVLVLIMSFSKKGGTSNYTSVMKANGFTVQEVDDNSEVGKTYNAKNASKNYTSGMSVAKSADIASALYSTLKLDLYDIMKEDSSWVPDTDEKDNTYTIESDSYYAILSISGKNVCYIRVPVKDKSVAKEIMKELGY